MIIVPCKFRIGLLFALQPATRHEYVSVTDFLMICSLSGGYKIVRSEFIPLCQICTPLDRSLSDYNSGL